MCYFEHSSTCHTHIRRWSSQEVTHTHTHRSCAPIMPCVYPCARAVSPSRAAPSAFPSLDVLDGNLLDGPPCLPAGVRRAHEVTPAAHVSSPTDAPAVRVTALGHGAPSTALTRPTQLSLTVPPTIWLNTHTHMGLWRDKNKKIFKNIIIRKLLTLTQQGHVKLTPWQKRLHFASCILTIHSSHWRPTTCCRHWHCPVSWWHSSESDPLVWHWHAKQRHREKLVKRNTIRHEDVTSGVTVGCILF